MLERLVAYFTDRTWVQLGRDFLDVSIVYYLFYRALLVVRGTRAIQVGFGLGAVLLLYVVAQRLQLETVINILGALISSMILLVVVVFQNDIRRGLMRLGRGATWTGTRNAETRVIDDVVEAATELARHRMGAIICFEKDANLDEFVEQSHNGIDLDAQVSRELLVSLFIPEGTNKLHDGAIIIRNLRIAKAGVFF
ncbi:MAG: diadenylate cyclase, partial [Myxococcales bacterium]|nr:diadenylate cyclase [Myxococcales bacterium]